MGRIGLIGRIGRINGPDAWEVRRIACFGRGVGSCGIGPIGHIGRIGRINGTCVEVWRAGYER